ncbi:HEAT repeat domain-containing protein [Lyngbya aestuarii]|uniref:HEAT repeat domain-containing protein n=1 Tax=Lyngbya aestuarii TaxID=118322 RepID=UPI00403DAFFF
MSQYSLDQLRESMVKILNSEGGKTAGSGFIIRADGYLVTCHHVIYLLDTLKVEYQGQEYEAQWCEELSNPEVDIAILKISIEGAKTVPIINPPQLATSVTVYGFPPKQENFFPEGIDISAQNIRPSAPVKILPTYPPQQITASNPWNKLPQENSTFTSQRIDAKVDRGTSGGPVFAEELGGVVGVIQSSKSDESYVIRWDNILGELDLLGLEPGKNAVCQFLAEIEEKFNYISFFHIREQKISLREQYIPVQVSLETQRKDVESFLDGEIEAVQKRAYALKGLEESQRSKLGWQEVKKQHQNENFMVLADPGMGKSTLLRMEAATRAQEEREKLEKLKGERSNLIDQTIFPIWLRLSDLAETDSEIINAIPNIIQRDHPKTYPAISHLLQEKLDQGKCFLLLDALDEVPKVQRNGLKEKLQRFKQNYSCPIICTSRIVGYGGGFLEAGKEVEIVPFSQQQTEEYIETWFKNAEEHTNDHVSAEELITELRHKPQIGGLVQNPLLLSLLCSLYQEKGLTLPARRTEVYKQAVDYMLNKWSANRHSVSAGKIAAKIRLLEEVAYYFSCDEEGDGSEVFDLDVLSETINRCLKNEQVSLDFKNSTPSELIEELSEKDGILQKWDRQGNKYLFLHRTFQEYLTAAYLQRKIQENQTAGIALVKKLLWQYDCHETLMLLAGLMKDPIPLLEAITKEKDDIFKTQLLLAGRCLGECGEISHPLIGKIVGRIYKFWHSYPTADFINSTVVVLGKANSRMVEKLQAALKDSDSFVRRQAAVALGEIGNAQAVEALSAALKDSDSFVRREAAEALGEIGNAQAVEALIAALNNSDSEVRSYAAEALGEIGNAETLKKLIYSLEINIYRNDIFPLARKLAVRFSKEKQPFIPVYPKLVRFTYSPIWARVKRLVK